MNSSENTAEPARAKPENPLIPLLINIIIPVIILNRMEGWLPQIGPWGTLALALCFPLYGAAENLWRKKKIGLLPGLGALNTLGSGGLAALGLGGIWFAIKEALFPLLIGLIVLWSAFRAKPFAEFVFLNDSFVHADRIKEALIRNGSALLFHSHLKRATIWLSGSFFMSAALNFALALYVFTPLDPSLTASARTQLLNPQVAQMTWLGFAVIALPSMLCLGAIFWQLLRDIRSTTQLKDEEIFRT